MKGGSEVVPCTRGSDPAPRPRAQTHQKVLSNQSYTFRKIPAMMEDDGIDAAVSVGGRRRQQEGRRKKKTGWDAQEFGLRPWGKRRRKAHATAGIRGTRWGNSFLRATGMCVLLGQGVG